MQGYRALIKRAYLAPDVHRCYRCENKNYIKYPNAICAYKIIRKEEGFRGFFKGLSMRMTTQSLSCAMSWSIYEYFKKVLSNSRTLK